MGRLIDADALREEIYSWGMNDYDPYDFIDEIDDAPTVEAIPKADYENRLKADMVAMLTDIQLETEELKNEPACCHHFVRGIRRSSEVIRQKINSLKEQTDDNEDC